MNAKKTNTKKILNIVVNVILWLFVAFAVVVTVVAVTASANKKNVPVVGGKCFLSVQSQSMNAAKPEGVASDKPAGFAQGDMIVGRYICDDDKAIDALEAGDVITFEFDINGDGQISPGEYNTHRIIAVKTGSDGKAVSFVTKGDNNEMQDANAVTRSKIIAVYTGSKIGGLGAAQTFLGSQLGFGLCILLPLMAFFIALVCGIPFTDTAEGNPGILTLLFVKGPLRLGSSMIMMIFGAAHLAVSLQSFRKS